MRDEIKTKLDGMMKQSILHRVSEPTEWVNTLVYVRKSNSKLSLCLEPKDLNRAIMQYHHKIPTIEELAHNHFDAKYFFLIGC